MTRFFVWLLLSAFLSVPLYAQVTVSPKFHKFGRVSPGKKYQIKATITNPTDQTISLWNLQTDCECTVAKIDKAVLKPKASTTLTIDYKPQLGDNGFKSISVNFQVYSQDKQHGIQRNMEKFMFSAEVHSPFTLNPATLDAGETMYGHDKVGTGSLKLDADAYPKWQPGNTEVSVPGLTAQVKASKTPGTFDVSLAVPGKQEPGNYKGNIKIKGKKAKDASFDYPFHAIVGSSWNIDPKFIHVGLLDGKKLEKWQFETQVRNVYGKKFKVLKLKNVPKWLSYSEDHNKAGDFLLRWKINQDELKKAVFTPNPAVIVVETDLKQEADINLDLDATWPAPTATATPKVSPTVTFTPTATATPGAKANLKK